MGFYVLHKIFNAISPDSPTFCFQMEDAISSNTLIKYETKCNDNIADVMALLSETVSPGVLINLESLLILDIQGELVRGVVQYFGMPAIHMENTHWNGMKK